MEIVRKGCIKMTAAFNTKYKPTLFIYAYVFAINSSF